MESMKNPRSESRYDLVLVYASRLFFILLASISLLAIAPDSSAQEKLIVQPRRVVLTRSGRIAKEFPERKKAIVRYPIVSGLTNKSVLAKIQKLLSLKSVFESTLEEYRRDSWLLELNYKVAYNKNYLFDITFSQSGEGAYPDTQFKHLLINLRTGEIVKASDAFTPSTLTQLAAMADKKLQAEVAEIIKSVETEKDVSAEQKSSEKESLAELKFKVEHLDDFSVSDQGITFLFDAGFPHVIKALEPDGRYFFSYSELKSFIEPNGLLGRFINARS